MSGMNLSANSRRTIHQHPFFSLLLRSRVAPSTASVQGQLCRKLLSPPSADTRPETDSSAASTRARKVRKMLNDLAMEDCTTMPGDVSMPTEKSEEERVRDSAEEETVGATNSEDEYPLFIQCVPCQEEKGKE